jgi:hypothetical protein
VIVVDPGDSALPFKIVVTDENNNRRTISGSIGYRAPESLYAGAAQDPVSIRAQAIDFRPDRVRGLASELSARGLDSRFFPISQPPAEYRLNAADVKDSLVLYEGTEALLSRTTLICLSPDREARVWLPDSSLCIGVPVQAVYEPAFLSIERSPADEGPAVFAFGPDDLALQKPLVISFAAPADPKAALYSQGSPGGRLSFVEARRQDGRIDCSVGGPAHFTFAVDSVPPQIHRLRPAEGELVERRPTVSARLEDDLSGVADDSLIIVRIDGAWTLPEFDPETALFWARPWEPLAPGSHRLELEVHDRAGNVTHQSRSFRVK